MISLRQPVSGKELRVADEGADYWRSLGYRDLDPEPQSKPVKKAAKRTQRKADEK